VDLLYLRLIDLRPAKHVLLLLHDLKISILKTSEL
jgi:hypothetical protein